MTRITIQDTDMLLAQLLDEADAYPDHPLSARVLALDRALRRGDPWPTSWAGRRIENIPGPGPDPAGPAGT